MVRLLGLKLFSWGNITDLKVSNEEFAGWTEQLPGYAVERTGLKLMDLDAREKQS